MLKAVVIIAVLLAAAVGVAGIVGARRWAAGTRALRERIDRAQVPVAPARVDFRELEGLPEPVARYFRTALRDGQPMVTRVRVRHEGTFNMGEGGERWRPFTSEQVVVTRRPGFDWDGRVRLLPGLTVRVHDAYVAGEGVLHAAVLGLVPVVELRGAGQVAEGELMRFFAEAAWYPTALLPSQGVRWDAVDERSARATLTDGPITLTMTFTFDETGGITTVRADARGRTVGTQVVPTPWQGRFRAYAERGGMRVPLEGEVAWLTAEGERSYWRGRIVGIEHEFAR